LSTPVTRENATTGHTVHSSLEWVHVLGNCRSVQTLSTNGQISHTHFTLQFSHVLVTLTHVTSHKLCRTAHAAHHTHAHRRLVQPARHAVCLSCTRASCSRARRAYALLASVDGLHVFAHMLLQTQIQSQSCSPKATAQHSTARHPRHTAHDFRATAQQQHNTITTADGVQYHLPLQQHQHTQRLPSRSAC
jgi:hypothetical protein